VCAIACITLCHKQAQTWAGSGWGRSWCQCLRKPFDTMNHYLQHHTATPSTQLLGPFERETESLFVWHDMLHLLAIASRGCLKWVPHTGVEDNPMHMQHAPATGAVLSLTTQWGTHDAHHSSTLHHLSYKTHPHTTHVGHPWWPYQPRGGSSTMKVGCRGELLLLWTGVLDGPEIAGTGHQHHAFEAQLGCSNTPQLHPKWQPRWADRGLSRQWLVSFGNP